MIPCPWPPFWSGAQLADWSPQDAPWNSLFAHSVHSPWQICECGRASPCSTPPQFPFDLWMKTKLLPRADGPRSQSGVTPAPLTPCPTPPHLEPTPLPEVSSPFLLPSYPSSQLQTYPFFRVPGQCPYLIPACRRDFAHPFPSPLYLVRAYHLPFRTQPKVTSSRKPFSTS